MRLWTRSKEKDRELREVLDLPANTANTAPDGANTVDNIFANTSANRKPSPANTANTFPLLRSTINTLSRLVFFWVKDPGLGELAEQWAIRLSQWGWLRVSLGVIAVGLACATRLNPDPAVPTKRPACSEKSSLGDGALRTVIPACP